MKLNILIFLAITLIAAAATYMLDNAKLRAPTANPIPEFTFTDTTDAAHNITDFQGKIVLLNFWASWCTPCLKEFPDLIKAANAHPEDIVIIALSSDFKAEAMTKFLGKMQKQFPKQFPTENFLTALDDNAKITQGLFDITQLPETIVINKHGQISEKIIGANWTGDELNAKIEKLKLSP